MSRYWVKPLRIDMFLKHEKLPPYFKAESQTHKVRKHVKIWLISVILWVCILSGISNYRDFSKL